MTCIATGFSPRFSHSSGEKISGQKAWYKAMYFNMYCSSGTTAYILPLKIKVILPKHRDSRHIVTAFQNCCTVLRAIQIFRVIISNTSFLVKAVHYAGYTCIVQSSANGQIVTVVF